MFCKHCGNEIDDNSLYCKVCGKKQDDKPFLALNTMYKVSVYIEILWVFVLLALAANNYDIVIDDGIKFGRSFLRDFIALAFIFPMVLYALVLVSYKYLWKHRNVVICVFIFMAVLGSSYIASDLDRYPSAVGIVALIILGTCEIAFVYGLLRGLIKGAIYLYRKIFK